jgi:hypothetical protein
MKTPFRFSLIARLTLIFLSVLPLSAQVPMLLEYDGFLEAKGKPVNGNQTMQVKIYDAAKGGKVLYTENVGKVNGPRESFTSPTAERAQGSPRRCREASTGWRSW